jgi:hypothetical protein
VHEYEYEYEYAHEYGEDEDEREPEYRYERDDAGGAPRGGPQVVDAPPQPAARGP